MKQEIRYQASAEVVSFIHRWQNWLKDERRYSLHTLDAYSRDLSVFFDFLKDYLKRAAERARSCLPRRPRLSSFFKRSGCPSY